MSMTRPLSVSLLTIALAMSACGKKNPTPATTAPATTIAATTTASTEADAGTTGAGGATGAGANDAVAATVAHPDDAGNATIADAVLANPDDEVTATVSNETMAAVDVDTPVSPLEAAAKELVEKWVAAQNQGDYDAYARFYAMKFTGVKRAGPRVRKFDAKGWLADRKKMFKQAMQVAALDISVDASAKTAVVTFTQQWASGTFQDQGPKQLVLLKDKDGLLISREEMLKSEVLAPNSEAKPIGTAEFLFTVALDGSAVLLPVREVNTEWGGAPKLVQIDGPTIATIDVDPAKAPAEVKAWLGKEMALFGPEGTTCKGKVDRLVLIARYTPHFSTVQHWKGTDEDFDDAGKPLGKAMAPEAIAQEVFEGGSADVELVGHVAGCTGTWARDASQPAVHTFAPWSGGDKLETALVAELRKLDGWKAIAEEAKGYTDPLVKGSWDEFDGAKPSVAIWSDDASGKTFASVEASAGIGCGSFGGQFAAIFEVKDAKTKPTFVLLTDPAGGPTGAIDAVVDLDGDGDVEFLQDEGLIQRAGPIWKQTIDVSPPYLDCPC